MTQPIVTQTGKFEPVYKPPWPTPEELAAAEDGADDGAKESTDKTPPTKPAK